jgi:hypothetical protein
MPKAETKPPYPFSPITCAMQVEGLGSFNLDESGYIAQRRATHGPWFPSTS